MIKIQLNVIVHRLDVGVGASVVRSGLVVELSLNRLGYPFDPFRIAITRQLLAPVGEAVEPAVAVFVEVLQEGAHLLGGRGMVGDVVIAALEEDGIISTGGGAVAVSSGQERIERLKKYADLGTPYIDLPDMNAALGIVQLSKIDTLLERRRSIYQMYLQAQRKSDTRLFGSASPLFSSNGYGFSVIVKARPDDSIAFANKYSVSCKRTFSGSVGQRYQDKYDRFPNAISAITRAISFPLYPFLSKNEIESIQRVISHLG